MNVKAVATLAPFLNAVLYGLYYALLERIYQKMTLSTVVLISAITSMAMLVVLTGMKLVPLDFSFTRDKQSLMLVFAAQGVYCHSLYLGPLLGIWRAWLSSFCCVVCLFVVWQQRVRLACHGGWLFDPHRLCHSSLWTD